jgi:Gene product 88
LRSVRPLLVQGNSKLGEAIHHFDLPAIGSCPGSTELCRRVCYAASGRFLLASVMERQDWCYSQSRRKDFADRMAKEILRKGVIVCRVHTSGDLYSAEYAAKWLDVMRRCPQTRFYLYSRSYRVPAIAPVLEKMAALKNVRVWYSIDEETGVPDRIPPGVRLAYLQMRLDDLPEVADLIFRVRRLRRTIPLPLTCPHETEKGKDHDTTCGSCGKCFRD